MRNIRKHKRISVALETTRNWRKKKEIKYKVIQLNNTEYFDLFIGKRVLKKDIRLYTE
jgi:hypothetical protein